MNHSGPEAVIADNDDLFRFALRGILLDTLGITEVTEAETLDEATRALASNGAIRFAFLALDVPGPDIFTSIRATREAFPGVTVAVVSASSNRYDVLRALEAGAHGFVPKREGVRRLGQAIKRIGDGEIYLPPSITELETESPNLGPLGQAEPGTELDKFTPRQLDVLKCLVEGNSNKEIARTLSISESAVKFQIASLISRLGVKNRTEIAVRVSKVLS